MRPGVYTTLAGEVVQVRRTATGYLIRHSDGSVTAVSA